MAEAILFNAARTQAIEDNSIESGFVDVNGKLILVKHNGVQVDAGNVVGPQGPSSRYALPAIAGTSSYFRIATIDGLNISNGGHFNFFVSGYGDFGNPNRATILVHAGQRDTDVFTVRAWAWNLENAQKVSEDILFYRKTGPFLFEIWMRTPNFQQNWALTILSESGNTLNIDGLSTTVPSDLVVVPIAKADPDFASSAETEAGTITNKAVTPASLAAKTAEIAKFNKYFGLLQYPYEYSAEALDITPLLKNNWRNYSSLVANLGAYEYGTPKAFKTANGWITMRGLVKKATAVTAGEVLFTLPVGWRPAYQMLFAAYAFDSGAGQLCLRVDPNGDVVMPIDLYANTEISVSNIIFNVNAYTDLPLISPTTAFLPAIYGNPAAYVSPDGIVAYRGAIKDVAVSANAFNTAGALRLKNNIAATTAKGETHTAVANTNGGFSYGNISYESATYRPRLNMPQHISGYMYVGNSYTGDMLISTNMTSGWNAYGSTFPRPQATKTADGLVILHGLMSTGSYSQAAFWLPPGMRPKKNVIRSTVSNDAFARLDIRPDGAVIPVIGGNAWFSVDGTAFVAEQ